MEPPVEIHNYMSFGHLDSADAKDDEIQKLKFQLLQLKATYDSKKSPALLSDSLYRQKMKYLSDELQEYRDNLSLIEDLIHNDNRTHCNSELQLQQLLTQKQELQSKVYDMKVTQELDKQQDEILRIIRIKELKLREQVQQINDQNRVQQVEIDKMQREIQAIKKVRAQQIEEKSNLLASEIELNQSICMEGQKLQHKKNDLSDLEKRHITLQETIDLKSNKIFRYDEEILQLSKQIEMIEPSVNAKKKILEGYNEQALANNRQIEQMFQLTKELRNINHTIATKCEHFDYLIMQKEQEILEIQELNDQKQKLQLQNGFLVSQKERLMERAKHLEFDNMNLQNTLDDKLTFLSQNVVNIEVKKHYKAREMSETENKTIRLLRRMSIKNHQLLNTFETEPEKKLKTLEDFKQFRKMRKR